MCTCSCAVCALWALAVAGPWEGHVNSKNPLMNQELMETHMSLSCSQVKRVHGDVEVAGAEALTRGMSVFDWGGEWSSRGWVR